MRVVVKPGSENKHAGLASRHLTSKLPDYLYLFVSQPHSNAPEI